MEFIWILGLVFIFIFMAYVVLSLFFPEWVGITGKKAQDVMAHQQGQDEDTKPKDQDTPS